MIRPFVPAQNYEQSRQFYEALGFVSEYADENITILSSGDGSFILQNFYVEELAHNFMAQLVVADSEAWWRQRNPASVAERFGTKSPKKPAIQPWGLKVGFIHDPSGVLWHITSA
ncbi:MAG: hypothetical protein ACRED9_15440 [Caulobacteraceae bacterium]